MVGEVKPGRKTSEFYLYGLVVIVGALVTSGIFDCDPAACIDTAACYCPAWVPLVSKILGVFSIIGAALGYGKNRATVKAEALRAEGIASLPSDPSPK